MIEIIYGLHGKKKLVNSYLCLKKRIKDFKTKVQLVRKKIRALTEKLFFHDLFLIIIGVYAISMAIDGYVDHYIILQLQFVFNIILLFEIIIKIISFGFKS